MKMLNNKKGFTIVELLVGIAILSLILLLTNRFISTAFTSTRFENELNTAVKNAQKGIDTIKVELRGANSSDQGDYAINHIDNDEIIFFSDVDGDDSMEKIRYFLSGTRLYKTTTLAGALNDYTGDTSTTTISRYVNNMGTDIFTYYDGENLETANINDIRLVNVVLLINVTPGISPDDYHLETSIHLRNLKDNL